MIDDLQALLDDHEIEHFHASELLSREKPRGPKVVVPPEDLWPNILQTLVCADQIRERIGAPVHVWSGYRTREYNELVGGSPTSEHVQFRALDLHVPDAYEELKAIAAEVMDHAFAAGHATGLGTYDRSRFVHIDTGGLVSGHDRHR